MLSGPFFLVVTSLEKGSDEVEVSRKLARYASDVGLGMIFGEYLVTHVLDYCKPFVEDFSSEVKRSMLFLITSYPGENDIMDVFEQQLNFDRGGDPSKSELVTFLKRLWAMDEIESVRIALWDSEVPGIRTMVRRRLTFDQFVVALENYHSHPAETHGIFEIARSSSSALRTD